MEIPKLPKPKKKEKQKKVMCSKCSAVGHYEMGEETVEDIDFMLMTMKLCGHRFIISAWDEKAKEKRETVSKLRARLTNLIGSGDDSGAIRTAKKFQAAQLSHSEAMKKAWKEYGHLIEGIPTDALAGNEESTGTGADTPNQP